MNSPGTGFQSFGGWYNFGRIPERIGIKIAIVESVERAIKCFKHFGKRTALPNLVSQFDSNKICVS